MEGAYDNDKKTGKWTSYYKSGKLAATASYLDDKETSALFYHEDGSLDNDKFFFTRGAAFPGGPGAWLDFLNEHFKYPRSAIKKGIQGMVIVGIKITTNGTIASLTILQSVQKDLDEEALRVIRKNTKWLPALEGGFPTIGYLKQPIVFKLVK